MEIGVVSAHMVRRTPDRAGEQIADPFLQDLVRRKPDRVYDPFCFKILVDIEIGEARVGAKNTCARPFGDIASRPASAHSLIRRRCERCRDAARSVPDAELIEHELRVIAHAVAMPVPDTVLLFALRWADAGVHVEQNASRRAAGMNAVDPLAGQIS